jgi:hypothetical protein
VCGGAEGSHRYLRGLSGEDERVSEERQGEASDSGGSEMSNYDDWKTTPPDFWDHYEEEPRDEEQSTYSACDCPRDYSDSDYCPLHGPPAAPTVAERSDAK